MLATQAEGNGLGFAKAFADRNTGCQLSLLKLC